jgi:hypothetical protein
MVKGNRYQGNIILDWMDGHLSYVDVNFSHALILKVKYSLSLSLQTKEPEDKILA